jgi:hypothetical protein
MLYFEGEKVCICPKKLGSEIAPQITNHKKTGSANPQSATFVDGSPQCCGSEIRCIFDPWIGDPGSGMGENRIRNKDLG